MVLTESFAVVFPAVFLLHEVEELLFMRRWMGRHAAPLMRRFPRMKPLLEVLARVRTGAFAAAAAEECIIVAACTAAAAAGAGFVAWWCCVAAFALHAAVHCAQAAAVGGYVPGVATSLLSLPYCIIAAAAAASLFSVREMVLWGLAGTVLAAANLCALHLIMARRAK